MHRNLLLVLLATCLCGSDYPPFADRAACTAAAVELSQRLEAYIIDWLDGKVPATLPASVLPPGLNTADYNGFRLMRPEDVDPEVEWGVRPARPIDLAATRAYFPDPHVTYLMPGAVYAPFGSTLVIDGEFPHCRYFSIQVTPPFDPDVIRYAGWAGAPEVPLADVDIDPLPGHVNPFRPGADRNAANRSFHVEMPMVVGNPAAIEPAFQPPFYRAPGNRRFGSALNYQGPWGTEDGGHKRGPFDQGQLWVRYYAPDAAAGPLGGVAKPRLHWRLPDGRRYWIGCGRDWINRVNRTMPMIPTWTPATPDWLGVGVPRAIDGEGAHWGWDKKFGIMRSILVGVGSSLGFGPEWARGVDQHVTKRGEAAAAPNNLEQSATTCSHISYFTRGIAIANGQVAVVTGRMPTTPRTRSGESPMPRAQARYWSITSYDPAYPQEDGFAGAALASRMDDEITVDAQNRYIIVYSRAADRPANATAANGVTWVDWGDASGCVATQAVTLRWLSVAPDWSFALTPHEHFLGWDTSWASASFDRRIVGENHQRGRLADFQPRIGYLAKAQFEALGASLQPDRIPQWWGAAPTGRTIAGRIQRANGAPIAGARIGDGVRSVLSLADGSYRIDGVPGTWTVQVSASGFVGTSRQVVLDADRSEDFTLAALAPAPAFAVELSGTMPPGTISLSVGDTPVRPAVDGTWTARVPVPAGATAVELQARDALGHPVVRSIAVSRPQPQ